MGFGAIVDPQLSITGLTMLQHVVITWKRFPLPLPYPTGLFHDAHLGMGHRDVSRFQRSGFAGIFILMIKFGMEELPWCKGGDLRWWGTINR